MALNDSMAENDDFFMGVDQHLCGLMGFYSGKLVMFVGFSQQNLWFYVGLSWFI